MRQETLAQLQFGPDDRALDAEGHIWAADEVGAGRALGLPSSRLPLMIGGAGEKRTLRIVAEHADVWNTGLGEIETFRHKLDVLSRHCQDVDRDPAEIRKSLTLRAILAEDEAALRARRRELAPTQPLDESDYLFVTPEQCVERMLPFVELGAGDFLLAAYSPYDWRSLELLAREVAPALRPKPD